MDEEELEQPSSKINLGSFFERVDSVEKVANNALSRANANLGIISNQKLIINSINVTIEAMETKIRDIANYIIIEKKLEKDIEKDRALEEQDRLQKQAMVERATTIMGEPGPQGEQGQPAEEQKGSSLLGTLLRLGIGAFALKFIWPALLPLLKGSLGALGKLVFSKLGAGIGAAVGGTILSFPLLRSFRDPFQKKSEELGEKTGEFVAGKVNSIDEKGNVDTSSGGEVVTDSNVDINNKDIDNLEDTLEDKGLISTYDKNRKRQMKSRRKVTEKNEDKDNTDTIGMNPDYKKIGDEETGLLKVDPESVNPKTPENILAASQHLYRSEISRLGKLLSEGIDGVELTEAQKNDANNQIEQYEKLYDDTLKVANAMMGYKTEPFAADKVGEVDLQSKEYLEAKRINESIKIEPIDSDMTQAISKTNERIDNIIGAENKEQNNGNLVSANKPNVTDAKLKIAAAPLPFVKVLKNNQLSTSPKSYNGLPPEIAAMIS